MEGRGTLTVRTRRRPDEVEVEFTDEGPGIPEHVLPRVFDPFSPPPPGGTGSGSPSPRGSWPTTGVTASRSPRARETRRLFRVIPPVAAGGPPA